MSSYPPPPPPPGPGVGHRIEEAMELIEMELRHAIEYVNDAVIPQVRSESIVAMRKVRTRCGISRIAWTERNSSEAHGPDDGLASRERAAGRDGFAVLSMAAVGDCCLRAQAAAAAGAADGDGSAGVQPRLPIRLRLRRAAAPGGIPVTPVPEGGVSAEDKEFILSHRPIYSEEGSATWYTAPYKGRKAANGQVFSDEALTAAHRTLPMGSLIVVTNLRTRQASAMRISDRGPFVPNADSGPDDGLGAVDRDLWPGSAEVRVDVYETPKPMDVGGRWCVQIGPFTSESKAIRFKENC